MEEAKPENASQLDSKRSQYQDLDVIVESFDKWQNIIASLMKERSTLIEEVNILTNANEKLASKNMELEKTINKLHGTLDGNHTHLHMVCDLEEQNRSFKECLANKEQELVSLKDAMEVQSKEHTEVIQKMDLQYCEQVDKLTAELQNEAGLREQHLQGQINEATEQISTLQDNLKQLEQSKDAEIVKLTMEYENKLTQLKQKSSAAAMQQGGTSHQEIYRKKLQHLKREYEQEVGLLKKTIAELQQKLSSHPERFAVPSKKRRN